MANIPSYIHKTHHRSKSLKLSLNADGEVVVTTPPRISANRVEQFIIQNQIWIKQNQQKISQKIKPLTQDHILLFGKKYLKKIDPHHHVLGISISNGHCVYCPNHLNKEASWQEETAQKQLQTFLKNQAKRYIIPRTNQLATLMDQKFKKIGFKNQKTRWGSCSSNGNLNFNWSLVHYPTNIIDYVIVHELAHLTHLDHSARFWALVAKHHPNYNQDKNWLKKYSHIHYKLA